MLRQNNEYLRNVERISYSFAVLNTDTLGYSNPSFMEHLERWRMILGPKADPEEDIPLDAESRGMDSTLDALYDAERKGGLGRSSPNINRWLGDIRRYFPTSIVQVMQRDALERLGLQQMLLEPELLDSMEPDVHLVGTLLALNKVMPAKTRETARQVVRRVVENLEKKLRNPLRQAIEGALSRSVRNLRPRHNEIDWHSTIRKNLKHYQTDLHAIIPETLVGYGKKGRSMRHIILLLDQSGSMATSIVYAGILGAVMASIKAVRTQVVVFDTAVVDLSEQLHDPVELLFGTQLGGGTDIGKALAYAQTQVQTPKETILLVVSDLFEGGNRQLMLKTFQALRQSGVVVVSLLALSDEGKPAYDRDNAAALATLDIPAFACTPDLFPQLMAAAIGKQDLRAWAGGASVSI